MNNLGAYLLFASFGAMAAGCTSTPIEADYGKSVAEMTTKQTYDPTTRHSPSAAAVEGADPGMLQEAIKALRAEKVDRTKVDDPTLIQVGGR